MAADEQHVGDADDPVDDARRRDLEEAEGGEAGRWAAPLTTRLVEVPISVQVPPRMLA